jgi:hypothetical protein
MRIVLKGRYTITELRIALSKMIDKIERRGVTEVTGTNLYLTLYDEQNDVIAFSSNAKDEISYKKTDKLVEVANESKSFRNPALLTFKQPDSFWETIIDGETISIHNYRIRYDAETQLLIEEKYSIEDSNSEWQVQAIYQKVKSRTEAVLLGAQLVTKKTTTPSSWEKIPFEDLLVTVLSTPSIESETDESEDIKDIQTNED